MSAVRIRTQPGFRRTLSRRFPNTEKPIFFPIPLSTPTTQKDPFIRFQAGPCKVFRLKPVCPGKRIVFSAGKLTSPKTQDLFPVPGSLPVSPSPRLPMLKTKLGWALGPARVKKTAGSSAMKKSESMRELGDERKRTPGFPTERNPNKLTVIDAVPEALGSTMASNVRMWRIRALKLEAVDLTFGRPD